MDNLSDYVPLIIIIGSVIYSIVRGGGKKRREETAKTTLPGKTASEMVRPERKIQQPLFQPQSQPQSKPVKKVQKVQKETSPVKVQSPKLSQKESSFLEEEEYESGFLDIKKPENIRQAFIYSEILNRKEY
jgi:predicted ATP-dependent protease